MKTPIRELSLGELAEHQPGDDVTITVSAVLRINNKGRISSEVIDVSLDPDSLGPSEECGLASLKAIDRDVNPALCNGNAFE